MIARSSLLEDRVISTGRLFLEMCPNEDEMRDARTSMGKKMTALPVLNPESFDPVECEIEYEIITAVKAARSELSRLYERLEKHYGR